MVSNYMNLCISSYSRLKHTDWKTEKAFRKQCNEPVEEHDRQLQVLDTLEDLRCFITGYDPSFITTSVHLKPLYGQNPVTLKQKLRSMTGW